MMKKRLICGMAAAVLALSGGGAVVGNVACLRTDIAASAADADYENEDYVYTIKASGVIIKEYVGDSTTVNIPSKIDGVAVVDIAKGAFLRKNVEKVAVPSTVKTLESRVFEKCQNLKTVVLPDTLEKICSFAIVDCPNLLKIRVPKSVKTIEKNALGYYATNYWNSGAIYSCERYTDFTVVCYPFSQAQIYAVDNDFNCEVITDNACPEIVSIVRNRKYHQFRIEWEPVKGAQKYGIAVFLANKWKVINQDIPATTTTFTSPKLKEGSTYKIVVCAKVNGVWDTNKIEKRATSITVS